MFRKHFKILSIDNMKKTELNGNIYCFSVNYNVIDTRNIIDIYTQLMKKYWYKKMFRLIKNIFMGFLINIVNAFNHTKCISFSN